MATKIKQKQAKIKGVGDIVFCIDATGSMQPCIDSVKQNIDTFIRNLENSTPNVKVDWRARVMAYRDFNVDSEYLENSNEFVDSPDALKSQLDTIVADGGDDEPESTLDAILYATKKSDWRNDCHKIIVVFTDATPLVNINKKTQDELGVPDSFDIFSQTLQEERIKLFLYGQKSSTYDDIAKISRATVVQYDDAVSELNNADFATIMSMIGKTVSNIVSSGTIK